MEVQVEKGDVGEAIEEDKEQGGRARGKVVEEGEGNREVAMLG